MRLPLLGRARDLHPLDYAHVGRTRKGNGTWTGRLKSGNYQIECQQERHRPSQQYITIEENNDHTIELTPPQPITGILAVTTQPLGADIIIDEKNYGKTPQTISNLIIGQHAISLRKEQYKEEKLPLEITEGMTTEVDVELKDITTKTIESKPAGANLYLNGKKVGTTPYTDNLPAGEYEILLTRTNYHDLRQNVILNRNNPTVNATLKKLNMLPSCAYLMAGLQAGTFTAATVTAGFYTSNINIEASYLHGMKKSENIFWNYNGNDDAMPYSMNYSPTAFSAKAGYGFIVGTQVRITPQVGATLITATSNDKESKCYSVSACIGIRGEYALLSHLGLFVAPEVAFPAIKSDIYKSLSETSSIIKNWCSGFNIRFGVTASF